MRNALPVLASLVLLVGSGLAHGVRTGRWTTAAALHLDRAVRKLDDVPMTLGDWKARASTLDARQLAVAEISGHIVRRYTNQRTRREITVMLVCGRPGPIAVHTPDICYAGSGYEQMTLPERFRPRLESLPSTAEFSVVTLTKTAAAVKSRLRVFWSWNDGSGWKTPGNPRLTFAPAPFLYKLYLIRDPGRDDAPLENDPCNELLGQLLPALDKALFSRP